MLKSVEGFYHDGKVELLESVPPNTQGKVIVTFLQPGAVDLGAKGMDAAQAADRRHRLSTFAEDWDQPDMDVYDAD